MIKDRLELMEKVRSDPQLGDNLKEMQNEIQETMERREPINSSNLELGNIVLIKNYKNNKLETRATGPCVFIEYNNNDRSSALVYNTSTKRMHRAKIYHLSPVAIL